MNLFLNNNKEYYLNFCNSFKAYLILGENFCKFSLLSLVKRDHHRSSISSSLSLLNCLNLHAISGYVIPLKTTRRAFFAEFRN